MFKQHSKNHKIFKLDKIEFKIIQSNFITNNYLINSDYTYDYFIALKLIYILLPKKINTLIKQKIVPSKEELFNFIDNYNICWILDLSTDWIKYLKLRKCLPIVQLCSTLGYYIRMPVGTMSNFTLDSTPNISYIFINSLINMILECIINKNYNIQKKDVCNFCYKKINTIDIINYFISVSFGMHIGILISNLDSKDIEYILKPKNNGIKIIVKVKGFPPPL